MPTIPKKTQDYKYLVCAVYHGQHSIDRFGIANLTRVDHIGVILAQSQFSAIAIARGERNPSEERPTLYVASRILGPFRVSMYHDRTFTCEELLLKTG